MHHRTFTNTSAQCNFYSSIATKSTRYLRACRENEEYSEIIENINWSFNDPEATAHGRSPLSFAAQENRKDMCKVLIQDFGADPNCLDSAGKSAFQRAQEAENDEIVGLFMRLSNQDTQLPSYSDVVSPVSDVSSSSLVVDQPMPSVFTFSKGKQRSFIKQLSLENVGADEVEETLETMPDIKNNINGSFNVGKTSGAKGMSPLTYCVSQSRLDICEMLVEDYGADPTRPDKNGQTAIDVARQMGDEELVTALLDLADMSSLASDEDMKDPEDMKEPNEPDIHLPRFELFSESRKLQRLYKELRQHKIETSEKMLTAAMREEYHQDEVRGLLNEIKDFYEKQKELLKDEYYFQSMLQIRKKRAYDMYLKMNMEYVTAWIDAYNCEDSWDRHVDAIYEEFVIKKNEERERLQYEICQPILDFVQIYPFAIVTQNRVNEVVTRLAQQMDAFDGLYLPKDGPKKLDRAFEKAAFCPYESGLYRADIWDFCRGLITFNTLAEIFDAIDVFDKYDDVRVINVKLTFQKKPKDGESPNDVADTWDGKTWQDVKIHFWFNSDLPRLICELQLCLTHFTEKRRAGTKSCGGHAAYSKFRSLDEIERFVKSRCDE